MNENWLTKLTNKYREKGVFVDSNLLLVLFIGLIDKNLIPNFKKTRTYIPEDYDILLKYLNYFKAQITTPNVLTEVSNLASSLLDKKKERFYQIFSKFVTISEEKYLPSIDTVCKPECLNFGLTDTGILLLVKGNYLLLTDDFRLSQYFEKNGGDVVNFNHIRTLGWTWS